MFCLSFCPLFQLFLFLLFAFFLLLLFAFSLSKSVDRGFGLFSHGDLTLDFDCVDVFFSWHWSTHFMHTEIGFDRFSVTSVFRNSHTGSMPSSFVMHQGYKNSAPSELQHKNPVQCAEKMFKLFHDSTAFRYKFYRNV
jgi:hypothetical protein